MMPLYFGDYFNNLTLLIQIVFQEAGPRKDSVGWNETYKNFTGRNGWLWEKTESGEPLHHDAGQSRGREREARFGGSFADHCAVYGKLIKAAGIPKSPRICLPCPACAQLLAGAANGKHGPGANAGGTSAAGAHCSCKKHLHGRHSCSFQQNSCYYPFQYRAVILRFQYLRPPHTKQREVNTQLQRSAEWGEYFFFLSLFIFYIVQHKMPALHF